MENMKRPILCRCIILRCVWKLEVLAEGNNEENEGCIKTVVILMTITAVNYLKVTRLDNVPSRHKSGRALKHKLCSRPMSSTSSDKRLRD